jgi:hypothetical protein
MVAGGYLKTVRAADFASIREAERSREQEHIAIQVSGSIE